MTKFRRIVAMGAGSNHINLPTARQQIIKLSGKPKPTLLYLGTATFDSDGGFDRQVRAFAEEDGLAVSRLDLAFATPGAKEIQRAIEAADVVVVSGGNTLFAVRRWRTLGVDALLKKAMERGAVMAGGSAGSICWFDGGHSDSRDPTTTAGHARSSAASKAKLSAKAKKSWKQRAAEKARARKAKETRMGGGRRSDRIAAEAAQFGVIAEGGEEGTSTEMSQPPSSTSSKSGKPRWLRGSKKEKALFDPESGEPLNEAARIVRATQTVEPEFDEHTGAPLNHAARVIISGPAAGTSPTQMAPIAEEPEFDQVTGAAMNEAAQRLVGGRSDEPEFDELTGAPMNDAARRVMAQNS